MKCLALLLVLIFSFHFSFAEDIADITCTSEKDQRRLVIVKEGDGCRLDYTKDGQTKAIGNQKNGHDFCEKLVERVKEKLSRSNYECK